MKAYSQFSRHSLCCKICIFRLLLALPLSCFPACLALLICVGEFLYFCWFLLYFEGYSFLYPFSSLSHYYLTLHYPSPWCVFRLRSNMAHWLSFLSKWTVHHLEWASKPALRLWTHYTYKYNFFPHSSFLDGLSNRNKWFLGKGCTWLCTRF